MEPIPRNKVKTSEIMWLDPQSHEFSLGFKRHNQMKGEVEKLYEKFRTHQRIIKDLNDDQKR